MLTGVGVAALSGVLVASTGPELTAIATSETTAAVQSPRRGPGPSSLAWEWWNDADVQKELALSADKIKRINDFYGRRNADLRPIVHEFIQQSSELDKMTRDRVVDESTYLLQVIRVESARARLNESRTVMLYRMFRELTPAQHSKLQDILDRRFNRGGRGRTEPAK